MSLITEQLCLGRSTGRVPGWVTLVTPGGGYPPFPQEETGTQFLSDRARSSHFLTCGASVASFLPRGHLLPVRSSPRRANPLSHSQTPSGLPLGPSTPRVGRAWDSPRATVRDPDSPGAAEPGPGLAHQSGLRNLSWSPGAPPWPSDPAGFAQLMRRADGFPNASRLPGAR